MVKCLYQPSTTNHRRSSCPIEMDTDVEIVPRTVKHPSLFFPDGNIVLSIMHNNEQHLFKCHKSVLAKHSPVFTDMFELALYEPESEEYDGVLSITIPDAFEDVSALLTLLYDPLYVLLYLYQRHFSFYNCMCSSHLCRRMPYKKHHPDTAQTLHGPLKLATKYQMSSLRKRFISILQADWPCDLDDWDNNEAERAKTLCSHYGDKLPYPEPGQSHFSPPCQNE
jgi:BTB/POZ domain